MVNKMETDYKASSYEIYDKKTDLSWALKVGQKYERMNEDITRWWQEYKCVSWKIEKVYPIKTKDWQPIGHYGIIFEADSGKPKDWASEAYIGRDYSEFKAWQKVWHISYKRDRPATAEEKKMYGRSTLTDWIYVTVPYWANKKEYLRKALEADKREREERDKRLRVRE